MVAVPPIAPLQPVPPVAAAMPKPVHVPQATKTETARALHAPERSGKLRPRRNRRQRGQYIDLLV
ncbi:MAG: hypothetical protein ACTS3R_07555 [Inquilinaceae bacterium]